MRILWSVAHLSVREAASALGVSKSLIASKRQTVNAVAVQNSFDVSTGTTSKSTSHSTEPSRLPNSPDPVQS